MKHDFKISFDPEKLSQKHEYSEEKAVRMQVHMNHSEPTIQSNMTVRLQIMPDSPRLGGFSSEKADHETLELLKRF